MTKIGEEALHDATERLERVFEVTKFHVNRY
jgi:hypothetical protein